MRIALDGYGLGKDAKGIGRLTRNLLLPLPKLLPEDDFIVYTKEKTGVSARHRVEEKVLPPSGGYLRWQNGPLRKALKKANADLLIASNYVLPLYCPPRSIVIEHDISVISHPEWYPRRYALPRRYLVPRSLHRADFVIVPSTSVEREVRAVFKLPGRKVKVIGWGVEDGIRRSADDEVKRWREKKGLTGKKVIGFLGAVFKRRHVPELIRAVEILRREFPQMILYLVGEDFGVLGGGGDSPLAGREWVRWETSLPEEEVSVFYSSLDALAYLSEYEGFGLPPLEALACGVVPVLLERSSLAEVFTGLSIMVKTPDEREIAVALRAALTEEGTRSRLLTEFERRRPRFSWGAAAGKLAGLIGELKAG
jgi:glycosyltransferase involved in cell wall biosynthesis